MDNDLTCPVDAAALSEVRANLTAMLRKLGRRAPNSSQFVVSQYARPHPNQRDDGQWVGFRPVGQVSTAAGIPRPRVDLRDAGQRPRVRTVAWGRMHYRVKQSFKMIGDVPSEAAVDHLLEQLIAAAPDAGAVVALALGRGEMEVTMAFEAESAAGAVALAETAVAAVVGDGPAALALVESDAVAVVEDAAAALALVESGAVAVLGGAPVSVLVERLAGN